MKNRWGFFQPKNCFWLFWPLMTFMLTIIVLCSFRNGRKIVVLLIFHRPCTKGIESLYIMFWRYWFSKLLFVLSNIFTQNQRRSVHFALFDYDHLIVSTNHTEVTLDHFIKVNLLFLIINLNTEIVLYFFNQDWCCCKSFLKQMVYSYAWCFSFIFFFFF